MSEHPPINLLVVDSSLSEVERVLQTLRDADFGVELVRSDNESETQNVIRYKPLDMAVVRPGEGLPSVQWLRSQVQSAGKDIPILVALDDHTNSPSEVLRAGADNTYQLNEPEHLVLTVRKELRHLALRQQSHSLTVRLQETEARSQALLDASRDAIAYIHEGCHIYANPAYVELFGYASQDDLASLALIEMIAADDRDSLKRFLRDSMKQGDPLEPVELTGLKRDQSTFPMRLGCTPIQMDEEPCLQIVIHTPAPPESRDQPVADFTTHDVYTGIYNRKFFTQRIEEILNGSTRAAGGVLYILLTDYRSVSERLGLEAIDQLTVDLAKVLEKIISKDEVVARFSDAVFTVYTPLSARHSIMQLGERISTAIKDHVSHAAHKLITTASAIGICLIQDTHENAYQILGHADRACETARKMGPNHVQIFSGRVERTGEDKREEELVDLIRDAISGERLNLLYQPIASFQGTGEERYRIQLQILNRDQEPLAMAILEPVAERRGLMVAMDKWVIMRGLEKLAERYRGGKTPPCLFIPVSGNSLRNGGIADWLAGRLKDTGLTGDFVVVEVTEEHAEQYFNEAKALREQMRQMGCHFSLSQFGGKENSERILTHLHPDYIKIDSSLIEKLSKARDTASREAMAALTEKAQEMETKVVAEGISSAPQMASIWQYGVTLVQGDMVQAPEPEMDFDFHMFAG